jgi:predicted restriction endonuclease
MPRIERDLFACLLDAALAAGTQHEEQSDHTEELNWRIDDSWSLVRRRHRIQVFRETVLKRHDDTCAVCGTRMKSVIEAAHVRSYAAAPAQRANPANGICLCSFCHAAFDSGELLIFSDGTLRYASDLSDEIGLTHFTSVPADKRRDWLRGVDGQFLKERAGINK